MYLLFQEQDLLYFQNNKYNSQQIFVDYYTYYSENKEDPVLEIISTYWED